MVAFLFIVVCSCLAALTRGFPAIPFNPIVHLVGGKRPSEGRPEVLLSGITWNICVEWRAQNRFGFHTCKLMGCNSKEVIRPFPSAFYGPKPNHYVLLTGVYCDKYSVTYVNCKHKGFFTEGLSTSCGEGQYTDDFGLDCAPPYVDRPQIRLTGGARQSAGRVEIKITDEFWETVCERGDAGTPFSTSAATVVCRMLGFLDSQPVVRPHTLYGEGKGPILLSGVSCHGNESSILQCQNEGLGLGTVFCNHSQDVGVDCAPPLVDRPGIRLVGGGRPSAGRVELQIDPDFWETVCGRDGFDTSAALVVCRMLGISDESGRQPQVKHGAHYGEGNGPILLTGVSCVGNESSILQCAHNGLGQDAVLTCGHSQDVGVDCLPPFGPSNAGVTGPEVLIFDGTDSLQVNISCAAALFRHYVSFNWSVPCDSVTSSSDSSTCLLSVTLRDNNKNVICKAINAEDSRLEATATYRLNIVYGPLSASLTESQPDDEDQAGLLSLTCTAVNFAPAVTFAWQGVACDTRRRTADSESCKWRPASQDDGMAVICIVSNTNVSSIMATDEYNVTLAAPAITSLMLNNKEDALTVNAEQSLAVILACQAQGLPRPLIRVTRKDTSKWIEAGPTIFEGQVGVTAQFTLTHLPQCQDAATYRCEASNAVGNMSAEVTFFVYCRPQLIGANHTYGNGTETDPFKVDSAPFRPFTFDLLAYPAPGLRDIELFGDTAVLDSSVQGGQNSSEFDKTFVTCESSDIFIYRAKCIVNRPTRISGGGLFAATLANPFGAVEVFLQLDPSVRAGTAEKTRAAENGDVSSSSILPAAIAGTLAAVLATVLIAIGARKYHQYNVMTRYARCELEREKQYYSHLLQDVLGGYANGAPATDFDEEYHSIDDAHITSEIEPRPQFCKRQHRLSCRAPLRPRPDHVPLPPVPLAEGDLQTAARPKITRRWSVPDDYLHPAVCRQQNDDASDTASYQSAPFVYINPPSAASDSSSSKSEVFDYIDPTSKPGSDVVPVVPASDRPRHSLPQDNREPCCDPGPMEAELTA